MLEFHVRYYSIRLCVKKTRVQGTNYLIKMRRIIFCCDVMEGLLTSDNCKTQTVSTSWKQNATEDHLIDKHHDGMDDTDDISNILKQNIGSKYTNP